MTDKSYFSNCTSQEGFNPDEEMTKLISQKINCSLPWSSFEIQRLNKCKVETDFGNYLKALDDLQDAFKEIAMKCKYKSWQLFPIIEIPIDGNGTTSISYDVIWSKADSITIEKEAYVYTSAYFIGTFGGYLGLFLGGSILGYLDYIMSFFSRKFTQVSTEIQA